MRKEVVEKKREEESRLRRDFAALGAADRRFALRAAEVFLRMQNAPFRAAEGTCYGMLSAPFIGNGADERTPPAGAR